MPLVSTDWIPVSNDNTPHTAYASGQIDLALLLSEHYGKNIRQGQNFRVTGVQAWLKPAANSTTQLIDIGLSAGVKFAYIPTTSHSRKAWNNVFKQWKVQKRLTGAVGAQVRYDDMEFAWSSATDTQRTSTLYSTGLGDDNEEKLCLTGASSDGVDFCLEDYYNSSFEAPAPSLNHFDNSVIKEPKMGLTPFPSIQSLFCSCTNSAQLGDDTIEIGGVGFPTLGGAMATSPFDRLPETANVFCGLMSYAVFTMPDDTFTQQQEDFSIKLQIAVESWKPLVYRPKRRYKRVKSKSSGKSYRSKRRYSKSRR